MSQPRKSLFGPSPPPSEDEMPPKKEIVLHSALAQSLALFSLSSGPTLPPRTLMTLPFEIRDQIFRSTIPERTVTIHHGGDLPRVWMEAPVNDPARWPTTKLFFIDSSKLVTLHMGVKIPWDAESATANKLMQATGSTNLLLTSRQAHDEALPILMEQTTFDFHSARSLLAFLFLVGPDSRHITKIRLTVDLRFGCGGHLFTRLDAVVANVLSAERLARLRKLDIVIIMTPDMEGTKKEYEVFAPLLRAALRPLTGLPTLRKARTTTGVMFPPWREMYRWDVSPLCKQLSRNFGVRKMWLEETRTWRVSMSLNEKRNWRVVREPGHAEVRVDGKKKLTATEVLFCETAAWMVGGVSRDWEGDVYEIVR